MKKINLLAIIIILFTLTACGGTKPYESDVDGFTYTETDTISFTHEDSLLYTYTFSDELKVFVNENQDIYNFKNINDYKTASDNLLAFLDSFGENISYRTQELNFADKVELSLGATEDDYNTEAFTHGGKVYSKDAFITTDEGVTIIFSYTQFKIDEEVVIVPSFIQLFVSVIHMEESWEYLTEENEYLDEKAKLIHYKQIIVPLPMKTGVKSSWETLITSGVEVDSSTRAVTDSTTNTGTWTECTDDITSNCIIAQSTTLELQIYEMDEDDVIEFYEMNFGGVYSNGEFVFVLNGYTFTLYDLEEVNVKDDSGNIVSVTNAKIKLK